MTPDFYITPIEGYDILEYAQNRLLGYINATLDAEAHVIIATRFYLNNVVPMEYAAGDNYPGIEEDRELFRDIIMNLKGLITLRMDDILNKYCNPPAQLLELIFNTDTFIAKLR